MLKISANLAKRVPIAGIQFSSQQFSAGIEAEVGSTDDADKIKGSIRRLYQLLNEAIQEQVAAASHGHGGGNGSGNGNQRQPQQPAAPRPPANGNNKSVFCSQAQRKAIFAISKCLGQDVPAVLAERNLPALESLGLREASKLIDELKKLQNAGR